MQVSRETSALCKIMFQLCSSLSAKLFSTPSSVGWKEGWKKQHPQSRNNKRREEGVTTNPDNPLITNPHPLPLTAKSHLPPCPNLPSKIHVLFFQFNTHEPSQRGVSVLGSIPDLSHPQFSHTSMGKRKTPLQGRLKD